MSFAVSASSQVEAIVFPVDYRLFIAYPLSKSTALEIWKPFAATRFRGLSRSDPKSTPIVAYFMPIPYKYGITACNHAAAGCAYIRKRLQIGK